MNNTKISNILNALIITFALAGICFVAIIFPAVNGLYSGEKIPVINIIGVIIDLALCIPCFVFLVIGFKTSLRIRKQGVYQINLKKLRLMGLVLTFASALLAISNLTINIINAIMYHYSFGGFFSSSEILIAFIGLVGIAIGVVIVQVSKLIKTGKEFKEDSEAII